MRLKFQACVIALFSLTQAVVGSPSDTIIKRNINSPSTTDTALAPKVTPGEAHCGTLVYPHSCWKWTTVEGEWCWTEEKVYCTNDVDCQDNAPCYDV
ncbi:hypothetical protein H2248_011278 [Termitomyces sp. 'cryptogamus']|nr:hypothetical protein H2248_011278 [Termitomyces sp. 'cryptogamus']